MTYFVAIDPGTKWAVAVIEGNRLLATFTPKDSIKKLVLEFSCLQEEDYVIGIEDIHAGKGWGARQVFGFGRSLGFWHGFLAALNMEYTTISIHNWQEWATRKPKRPARKTKLARSLHKKALKAESMRAAQEAFPNAKIRTHDVADAINMARYLRWRHG